MDYQILIAGFGGQGILFTGKILAKAGLTQGKNVSWLPSYGPEMRGGTANCSVCVSDSEISNPMVLQPNILIVMNQPSWSKFICAAQPGADVFWDSTLIAPEGTRTDVSLHPIPATGIARQNGVERLGNVVMLGYLLHQIPILEKDAFFSLLTDSISETKRHLVQANRTAFEAGYAYSPHEGQKSRHDA